VGNCKESFDNIAQWVDPKLIFSKNRGWDNMALVGILGEWVLHFVAGDILEIGVGESTVYMTALANKYNRKCYYCDSNEEKVNEIKEVGYFSNKGKIYSCTSNEMFAKNELTSLAFTFIDGNHLDGLYEIDFWNAEKLTVPNGYILMHDTYPPGDDWIINGGNGTVYQFRQKIEQDKRFDVFTFVGDPKLPYAFTLIRKKPINRPYYQE